MLHWLGRGLALLSPHRFAQQDHGGPRQGALTFGAALPLQCRLTLGHHFGHCSDAGACGQGTTGTDFHSIDVLRRC